MLRHFDSFIGVGIARWWWSVFLITVSVLALFGIALGARSSDAGTGAGIVFFSILYWLLAVIIGRALIEAAICVLLLPYHSSGQRDRDNGQFKTLRSIAPDAANALPRVPTALTKICSFNTWQGIGLVRILYFTALVLYAVFTIVLFASLLSTGEGHYIAFAILAVPLMQALFFFSVRIVAEVLIIMLLLPKMMHDAFSQ